MDTLPSGLVVVVNRTGRPEHLLPVREGD